MNRYALIRWELRSALRSSWFLVGAAVFLAAGGALLLFATDSSILGSRGFGRGLAAFSHLAMVLVPLMSMLPAAVSIAGDRELGNLGYLLAQPISRRTVYGARWAGLAGATVLGLAITFGVIGSLAAWRGVPGALVLRLFAFTVLLSVAFASLGLGLSAATRSRSRATTAALALLLLLLALGSLGVMTAFVRGGVGEPVLRAWIVFNPVEAYRLATLQTLGADPATLGVVADAAVRRWGDAGPGLAVGSLVAWSFASGGLGLWLFRRADV